MPNVTANEALESFDEIDDATWRRAMQRASALEFLNDPAEDIYSKDDGEPIHWREIEQAEVLGRGLPV